MNKILVVGGSNIDYIGKSFDKLKANDSNIGNISISFGGVGRNITENLARLGESVTFVTSIGNDTLGVALKKELLDLGVEVIVPLENTTTGGYLAIHDNNGEMALGLCSQNIGDFVTIKYLKEIDHIIDKFDYLFLDTNLNKEEIDYLIDKFSNKTIFLDVISSSKGLKIIDKIDKIDYLKCNELEAKTLFGDDYFNKFNKNTLICTRGAKDILYNDGEVIKSSLVNKVDNVINETGAGDAFFGAFIYGIINGENKERAIEMGKRNASLTLKVNEAVNKKLNIDLIND